MRKGQRADALGVQGAQSLLERGQAIDCQNLAARAGIDDGDIAVGAAVHLKAEESHEVAGAMKRLGGLLHGLPLLAQARKAGLVKIDDVLDGRIGSGHVGPERVPRHRAEIQLLAGIAESGLQTAVAVGDVTVVVEIAIVDVQTLIAAHLESPPARP